MQPAPLQRGRQRPAHLLVHVGRLRAQLARARGGAVQVILSLNSAVLSLTTTVKTTFIHQLSLKSSTHTVKAPDCNGYP
jgi:hypothetical protein